MINKIKDFLKDNYGIENDVEVFRVFIILYYVHKIWAKNVFWENPFAVLTWKDSVIESRLGSFPGHISSSNTWKNLFNKLYYLTFGSDRKVVDIKIILQEIGLTNLKSTYVPLSSHNDIESLIFLYEFELYSTNSNFLDYRIRDQIINLMKVTERNGWLTKAEILRLIQWYCSNKHASLLLLNPTLIILRKSISCDFMTYKLNSHGKTLLILIWLFIVKSTDLNLLFDKPTDGLINNPKLPVEFQHIIDHARKCLLPNQSAQDYFDLLYELIYPLYNTNQSDILTLTNSPDRPSSLLILETITGNTTQMKLLHLFIIETSQDDCNPYDTYLYLSGALHIDHYNSSDYEAIVNALKDICLARENLPENRNMSRAVNILKEQNVSKNAALTLYCDLRDGKKLPTSKLSANNTTNWGQALSLLQSKSANAIDFLRRYDDNSHDYMFENSLVYNETINTFNLKNGIDTLIINPSWEFIRLSIKDVRSIYRNTVYIVTDKLEADCLRENSDITQSFYDFQSLNSISGKFDYIVFFERDIGLDSCNSMIRNALELLNPKAHLLVVGPDDLFLKKYRDPIFDSGFTYEKITVLPFSIAKSKRAKKVIIDIAKLTKVNTQINLSSSSFEISSINGYDYPRIVIDSTFAADRSYVSSLKIMSIRSYMKTLRDAEKSNPVKRKLPSEFVFSKEISFYYSITYIKSESTYRAEVYVCERPTFEQLKRNKLARGKQVKGSKTFLRANSIEDLELKIKEKAPYNKRLRNATISLVKNAIFDNAYRDISFKTFYYCYEELIVKRINYNDTITKQLHYNKNVNLIHNCMLCDKLDVYKSAISEITTQNNLSYEDEIKLWFKLYDVFLLAQNEKLIEEIPIKEFISNIRKKDKTQEVRDALTRKVLSDKEERIVYRWIKDKIFQKNNWSYAAVMIRLFTGLGVDEICALKWSDFESILYLDFYFLSITKRHNHKNKMETLSVSDHYRRVPIPTELSKILKSRYNLLVDKFGSRKVVDNLPMFCDFTPPPRKGSSTSLSKHSIPLPYRKLQKMTSSAYNSAKSNKAQNVIVPIEGSKSKATDLNKYYGDLLRSNFRYRAFETCGLKTGELCYILGTQAPDTFSKHYCDYSHDLSILNMIKKMDRWVNNLFVDKYEKRQAFTCVLNDEILITSNAVSSNVPSIDMIIELDGTKDNQLSVEIESEFGISGTVIMLEKQS